jgi:hypothetical protein
VNTWTELIDAAIIGAARGRAELQDPLLSGITSAGPDDGARRLLDHAAVVSRARRAGYVPADASSLQVPEPADLDVRPEVSGAAQRRIGELLGEGPAELVVEWLRLLAATPCRIPQAHLPALLTLGADDDQVREAMLPLLGPVSDWLASLHPRWAWAGSAARAVDAPGTGWATGGHGARRALLLGLRQRDPAAARALIASTWSSDSHRDRTAFIAALATSLSEADEPLLNQALADPRGEVRLAAARLLSQLPGSAFSRRACERAAAVVGVQRTVAGRRLAVNPPAEPAPEILADGLIPDPPRGTGRQAWLLRQLVAAVPAGWWPEQTGLPPARLLELAAASDWSVALAGGWRDAAVRDGDVGWISALLDSLASAAGPGTGGAARELLAALPRGAAEAWLTAHPGRPLFSALDLVPGPWTAGFSAAVRALLATMTDADATAWREGRRVLRIASFRLEPPDPPAREHAVPGMLLDSWSGMLATLSVRAAVRSELSEETP